MKSSELLWIYKLYGEEGGGAGELLENIYPDYVVDADEMETVVTQEMKGVGKM